MRTFLTYYLGWFKRFINVWILLNIIFIVCCIWIEFITWRKFELCWLRSLMRIWIFFIKKWSISCTTIKWLIIWVKLVIFYEHFLFWHSFRAKLIFIFRWRIKWDNLTFILHSRNYFFSHLWFISRIIFSVFRINIIIWSIFWSF